MEMLPEMEGKVTNVITRVKTTQGQVIPMERTQALEESFEVLFLRVGRHPTRKLGTREPMGGESGRGGGGVGRLTLILSVILRSILPISQPLLPPSYPGNYCIVPYEPIRNFYDLLNSFLCICYGVE